MWIESLRIEDYKRFRDTGVITFGPGMNIIVGQNDVGKTALMQALGNSIRVNAPHKSLLTLPTPASVLRGQTRFVRRFRLTGEEISTALAGVPAVHAGILQTHEHWAANQLNEAAQNGGTLLVEELIMGPTRRRLAVFPDTPQQQVLISNSKYPSGFHGEYAGNGTDNDHGEVLFGYISPRIYEFRAQRYNLAIGNTGTATELVSDATNLAEVLNNLQSANFHRYQKLLAHVREVFPHILHVGVRQIEPSRLQIEIWDTDPSLERDDLAIPLSESGTGIGQVLAMLYVVVNSRLPRVILIDEPHSFLHPGAIRKLFEIFEQYSQHQYIITTHSPTALTSAKGQTLHIVRRAQEQSVVQQMDPTSALDLSAFLREVGARLSDVFGPDRILWCEGKTEALCFPMILRAVAPEALIGIDVFPVAHTADLEGRHAEKVVSIYHRLSGGVSVLPPAVAFVLDREDRNEAVRNRLSSEGRGLVHFLERRMYENYLLDPAAIAAALNDDDSGKGAPYSAEVVSEWIGANGERFVPRVGPKPTDVGFLSDVDGAKLIAAMFSALTETRVAYDKARHGPILTAALLETQNSDLRALGAWLAKLIYVSTDLDGRTSEG